MAKIIVSMDGQLLQEVALTKERITIGRRPHNDVVLDMRSVSAEHAAIMTFGNDSFLEDLDSTNGTQVNGQPVHKHYLQNHDVIQLAKYEIRYFSSVLRKPGDVVPPIVSAYAKAQPVIGSETRQRGETSISGTVAGEPGPIPVVKVISGPSAGKELVLTKSLTTIGRPGVQVAVITRRPMGFVITHVEGDTYPLVNGVSIGKSVHPIVSGDVIILSGTEMEFLLR
ncbi:NAD-dependent DNA ligase [Actimicrobium sp. GrIS 1.19]|uniref:FHA domain-containing protein n=1 Tax=Actimicrobium sp. GrIS 1.19 TaxID=3071708 RepID=UPI002E0AAD38|nr:NAD-dependent DNA ligase [Actimicrobium sp. GrIS 1.19]